MCFIALSFDRPVEFVVLNDNKQTSSSLWHYDPSVILGDCGSFTCSCMHVNWLNAG